MIGKKRMIISSIDAPNTNALEIRILKPFQSKVKAFIGPDIDYFSCNLKLNNIEISAHLRKNSQDYLISTDTRSGKHPKSLKDMLEKEGYTKKQKLALQLVSPFTFRILNEPYDSSLNYLDIALIDKAGQDNGWELSEKYNQEFLVLSSARHFEQALIQKKNDNSWLITWTSKCLSEKIKQDFPLQVGKQSTQVKDEHHLNAILKQLSELSIDASRPIIFDQEKLDQKVLEISRNSTEVERIVRQRLGQDDYRNGLLTYWGNACAVTGLDVPALLRASHAKPWAQCDSDQERLDTFNGFLLVAQLDLLFDKGYISFDDYGNILISSQLDETQCKILGVNLDMKLKWISERHQVYLNYHRENIFKDR